MLCRLASLILVLFLPLFLVNTFVTCFLLAVRSLLRLLIRSLCFRAKVMAGSNGQFGDHFLFKACDETSVRGICQQGFQLCACQQSGADLRNSCVFSRQSGLLLGRCRPNATGIHFMFCARSFASPSGNEGRSSLDGFHSNCLGISDLFRGSSKGEPEAVERMLITCLHAHQAYPEFLISFKLLNSNGFLSSVK